MNVPAVTEAWKTTVVTGQVSVVLRTAAMHHLQWDVKGKWQTSNKKTVNNDKES